MGRVPHGWPSPALLIATQAMTMEPGWARNRTRTSEDLAGTADRAEDAAGPRRQGEDLGVVLTLQDVTDAIAAAREPEASALVDPLTGLSNRRHLAQRLDEFVAVLVDVVHEAEAEVVAERLRHVLAEPYEIGGTLFHVTASAGVAVDPRSSRRRPRFRSPEERGGRDTPSARHGGTTLTVPGSRWRPRRAERFAPVEELFVLAVAVFGFALVSERLSMSPITAPMVFTTIGLIVGPAGLDWFDLELGSEAVTILVEATLVLVLFTDAVRIDLRALRRESWLPTRLLGVGLPLTVLAGTGVALVVLGDLSIGEAALLAAVLAPTDAALGQAVVSDRRLPVRLRQGLNVESGLNDGIALPLVTVLIAVVGAELGDTGTTGWVRFAAEQVGYGVTAGIVIGAIGAVAIRRAAGADAIEGVFRQLATIAVAAGAYAGASLIDGNGFMAAFVAGLVFGRLAGPACLDVQDFTQDEGELLTVITFVVFGAALAGPVLDEITWQMGVYAVLSLTVVRMVPVLVAMAGTGTILETRLFAGWFGPRGLASILFALLVAEELSGPGVDVVFTTVITTVLLSVYAHGVTASPWATRLAGRLAMLDEDSPEMGPAPEMPTRKG